VGEAGRGFLTAQVARLNHAPAGMVMLVALLKGGAIGRGIEPGDQPVGRAEAMALTGWCTVVNCGHAVRDTSESSNPATDSSSGTASPIARAAASVAAAMSSFCARTPSALDRGARDRVQHRNPQHK
jgi:hypothetical protein